MAMVGTWLFIAWVAVVLLIMMSRCAGMTVSEFSPPKPLQTWTFDNHKWVGFDGGTLTHHPDCPCKTLTKD